MPEDHAPHERLANRESAAQVEPTGTVIPPDVAALALAFYAAARAEILQRITLRDTTVLAWITTAGVLVGLAFKGTNEDDLRLRMRIAEALPAISLAFALAVYRHTFLIGCLGVYIKTDLNPFLRQNDSVATIPRHWDSSGVLSTRLYQYLTLEIIAYFALLIGPSMGCLVYLWMHDVRFHDVWFWEALACSFLVILVYSQNQLLRATSLLMRRLRPARSGEHRPHTSR